MTYQPHQSEEVVTKPVALDAAARVALLQRELLAVCRGSYAYETWARVTEQPISERTDWRRRLHGQARVDEIRCELHAINPNAALYFGWGPNEELNAKERFYERLKAASGVPERVMSPSGKSNGDVQR